MKVVIVSVVVIMVCVCMITYADLAPDDPAHNQEATTPLRRDARGYSLKQCYGGVCGLPAGRKKRRCKDRDTHGTHSQHTHDTHTHAGCGG